MGWFKHVFRHLGNVFKHVSKPLLIGEIAYKLIKRKKHHKSQSKPTYIITQKPQTQSKPQPRPTNYTYANTPQGKPTVDYTKMFNTYMGNMYKIAQKMARKRIKEIKENMAERGLLRSGWTAQELAKVPASVWTQLSPQINAYISSLGGKVGSDWYNEYLKKLAKWQASLR